MSARVAAIDCGTNSIRLLIADVGADGRLVDLVRRMEIVRLGQDIDRTGVIAPEATERTLAMTREYAAPSTWRARGVGSGSPGSSARKRLSKARAIKRASQRRSA